LPCLPEKSEKKHYKLMATPISLFLSGLIPDCKSIFLPDINNCTPLYYFRRSGIQFFLYGFAGMIFSGILKTLLFKI